MRHRHAHLPALVAPTVAVAILLAACSSGDDDAAASSPTDAPAAASTAAPATTPAPAATAAPTTTESPTTTAAPTTAASTTAVPTTTAALVTDAVDIGDVGTSPEDGPVVLSPGPYTLGILEPYAFEIDEEIQIPVAFAHFVLVRDPAWLPSDRAASIMLLELNGLVPPDLAADESVRNLNGPAQPEPVLPTPVDLPAWIEDVPSVSISGEGVIEAPGTIVRWWDLVLDAEAGPTFRCGADTADCVGSFVSSPEAAGAGVLPLQAQNLQRVYLFDALPGVFGLVDSRDPVFFERGVEIMEMIVGSLAPTA